MASTGTFPPGPPSSVASMLSEAGISNPRATSTATSAAISDADAANTANAADQTAASATQTDPLAASSAGTALTGPTPSADSANGENGSGLEQASSNSSGGMSSGTKIGIGVGVGVGVAVLIALIAVFFVIRRRRKSRYNANGAEQMRGQPGMTSTEPALAGVSALGRSPSYRSNNRSSYHSLAPTSPPPLPETAAEPMPETAKGTIPAQPIIIPPSQSGSPREAPEAETPRGRQSMEAEIVAPPGNESLFTPAPPYDEAPSPMEEHPSRPVSPVSPVSSIGSRPPSLRRSIDS